MKNKNSSQLRKDKKEVSSHIGIILMVAATIVIAALVLAMLGGFTPPSAPSFYVQIEEVLNENYLKINASHTFDSGPLPNVTVAIYEHGVERLLSGPQMTDETGCAIIEIPKGYHKYFDIVAVYEGRRSTLTVDKRPLLVKSEDTLGQLGIAVFSTVLAVIAGVLGWLVRGHFEKSKRSK
jgi:hypothetical protein